MTDPLEQKRTQLANIERATGRNVAEWAALVQAAGKGKHGEIIAFLKTDHGFTHGNANALAHAVRELDDGGPPTQEDLLAAQFTGAKAALRPIYDELLLVARGLGEDIDVLVNKTGVSLRARKQFAVIEVPSAKRVRVGLVLKGREPTDRLRAVRSMCTHTVDVTDVDDIDDELTNWLLDAYRATNR
ncbi:DUF4287 domain-containing protein [Tenggerimyces flavus]|uniref:DUF4287 domain-containing protein n=1 Tax=Tenggerimyces flavus TaxID=1708749 RepID=A0ABV7YK01_9ACTN|nr:DUF4287 domain-containing protein [Tenggerimyces flavus]MBM7789685.1 hypothetical protein [Tenggerimyces flavus]